MEKNTLAAYLEQIFNLEKSVLVQQNLQITLKRNASSATAERLFHF